MGYVESFNLNGISIKTTVTSEHEHNVVNDHISSFERQLNDYNHSQTKFFGFDTEWRRVSGGLGRAYHQCAISLCDGNSCLIISISGSVSVPQSLVNFLSHPNYIFVGIGIKDNVTKLEKNYGFGCRNVVELAPWASRVFGRNRLSYCGVDELAYTVCSLDLRKDRPLCTAFVDWGQFKFNRDLAKHITINVVSYQKIGSRLFSRDN